MSRWDNTVMYQWITIHNVSMHYNALINKMIIKMLKYCSIVMHLLILIGREDEQYSTAGDMNSYYAD